MPIDPSTAFTMVAAMFLLLTSACRKPTGASLSMAQLLEIISKKTDADKAAADAQTLATQAAAMLKAALAQSGPVVTPGAIAGSYVVYAPDQSDIGYTSFSAADASTVVIPDPTPTPDPTPANPPAAS